LHNTELLDIEASLQTLVRRAYDLGRNDALKKVVEVLNGDRPFAEQLALMGPNAKDAATKGAVGKAQTGTDAAEADHDAPAHRAHEHEHEDMNLEEASTSPKPWWAWPVR